MKLISLFQAYCQVSALIGHRRQSISESTLNELHRCTRDLIGWNRRGNNAWLVQQAINIKNTKSRDYLSHILKHDVSDEEAKRFRRYLQRKQIRRNSKLTKRS